MTNKDQVLKMIEGRINTMTALAIECTEMLYNAGYNAAIEAAAWNMAIVLIVVTCLILISSATITLGWYFFINAFVHLQNQNKA